MSNINNDDDQTYARLREAMDAAYAVNGFSSVMWLMHETSRQVRSAKLHQFSKDDLHRLMLGNVNLALSDLEKSGYRPKP
ncbi:hypothetical protein [Paraburkholderia tropica]|uniref:hypothetical protein n=1 Tax=Paraburkholderia tropica TaxID=92647 RepID=UPI002ABE0A2B|nr:hypothetical protein [Paraburkholderia tropica]